MRLCKVYGGNSPKYGSKSSDYSSFMLYLVK
jgi:hypothetical protein